jgi:hypothetical protein
VRLPHKGRMVAVSSRKRTKKNWKNGYWKTA